MGVKGRGRTKGSKRIDVNHALKQRWRRFLPARGNSSTVDKNVQTIGLCCKRSDRRMIRHIELAVDKTSPVFCRGFKLRTGNRNCGARILKGAHHCSANACPACAHNKNMRTREIKTAEFRDGIDALGLQPVKPGSGIPVDFGLARNMPAALPHRHEPLMDRGAGDHP